MLVLLFLLVSGLTSLLANEAGLPFLPSLTLGVAAGTAAVYAATLQVVL